MSVLENKANECFKKQIDPETSSYECSFHYTDEKLFGAGYEEGYRQATSEANGDNSKDTNCAIFSVMASFLEQKAKEHKCKATDLNIGYSEGDVYLYKIYYDTEDKQSKVAWEQDLNTGEIIY